MHYQKSKSFYIIFFLTLFLSNSDAFTQSTAEAQFSESLVIKLTEVTRFGSTDENLIGVVSAITVDDQNRVFLADRNQTIIHVFEEDGAYLTSLGRKGRGPAEFSAINPNTTLAIHRQQLYVTDYANEWNFFPDRLQVFSLTDFKFLRTVNLLVSKSEHSDHLRGYYPTQVYPLEGDSLIVAYKRMPAEYGEEESLIKYIIQTYSGEIVDPDFFNQPDRTQLVHFVKNSPKPYDAMHAFPFFPRSLFAVSKKGDFYAARTDKINIGVFSASGNPINRIEHSIETIPILKQDLLQSYENRLSSLGEGVATEMIRNANNLPEHWPVIRNMLSDDEGRIWVSTREKDFDLVNWWILKENGEVVGRFTWPANQSIREIRNGHIYTLEENKDTYLQEVVKYKIELTDTK